MKGLANFGRSSNLTGFLNICDIDSRRNRPEYMKFIFVQLKQKHDQNEKCVEHEESKNRFVSELF